MNCIISIDALSQLLDTDLPKRSKKAGMSLFYPDLYKGPLLSPGTQKCLHYHQLHGNLHEMACSEKVMERYHQGFIRCGYQHWLSIEDYVAVAYAKDEGCVLLTGNGCLSRYAQKQGVEVMSLEELEQHVKRQRQVRDREARLKAYLLGPANKNKQEKQPKLQSIDDDTAV